MSSAKCCVVLPPCPILYCLYYAATCSLLVTYVTHKVLRNNYFVMNCKTFSRSMFFSCTVPPLATAINIETKILQIRTSLWNDSIILDGALVNFPQNSMFLSDVNQCKTLKAQSIIFGSLKMMDFALSCWHDWHKSNAWKNSEGFCLKYETFLEKCDTFISKRMHNSNAKRPDEYTTIRSFVIDFIWRSSQS